MAKVESLQKIKVKKTDGTIAEAEVLLCFQLEETGKNYILYTFNEVDEQEMETVHASIISETEDGYELETIPPKEWNEVKDVMRDIIRNEER